MRIDRDTPKRRSRSALIAILAVGLGLLGVPLVLFELLRVPSGSMLPTIPIGARVVGWRFNTGLEVGDIVVYAYPQDPSKLFAKRVVAVGGDTVAIQDNQIIRNGSPVPRRRIEEKCSYLNEGEERSCVTFEEKLGGRSFRVIQDKQSVATDWKPDKIPPGHVYVLGDNRDNSHDSRFWGSVPEANVHGRVFWILK